MGKNHWDYHFLHASCNIRTSLLLLFGKWQKETSLRLNKGNFDALPKISSDRKQELK